MINLFEKNPPVDPIKILTKLGEADRCLLTGEAAKLTLVPVDGDIDNCNPVNIAIVAQSLAGEMNLPCMVNLKVGTKGLFEMVFDGFDQFIPYNISKLEALAPEIDEKFVVTDKTRTAQLLCDLFNFLGLNHIKGIAKVSHKDYSMDKANFNYYLFSSLERKRHQESSNIVKLY
jgi:hypothetical protein